MKIPNWTHKIKRYSIRGRMYWYETIDGGCSWTRISAKHAMTIIDSVQGVPLDAQAATGDIRADGKELVGHDWDNGPEAWDVIRDAGEQWLAYANPEFTARIVAALNAQPARVKHATETWTYELGDAGAQVYENAETSRPVASCDDPDMAARIVACVNACAGMDTARIEELNNGQLADCAQAWMRDDE